SLSVVLSRRAEDVRAAQELRYRVFFEGRSPAPAPAAASRRDVDRFDDLCDHMLVLDDGAPTAAAAPCCRGRGLVGTYRLRDRRPGDHVPFYSQDEFDVAALVARKPRLRFLELGRSCVLESHRSRPVLELLWQGIWNYVRRHDVDVMFGCASLPGTDVDALAVPLRLLADRCAAPDEWRVAAHPHRRVDMHRLASRGYDLRRAMRALPTLLRGYVALGAYVGDGAVVDRQFGTVDVLTVLPVPSIDPRFFSRFGAPAPSR
ncbi:MAG TPA: GNAT family N-acyltransferase, partial [Aestuariivirgaceae bacterium]|nr:GNAT family N-acyltransferase [Aestuariivirgaceae bacterium]